MRVVIFLLAIFLLCFVSLPASAEDLELLMIEELLLDEPGFDEDFDAGDSDDEQSDPTVVVVCEFTCKTPIIKCGDWHPPPGSYSKDVIATRANAAQACRATADSVCKRCGGGSLDTYWYTIYRSVRWVIAESVNSN